MGWAQEASVEGSGLQVERMVGLKLVESCQPWLKESELTLRRLYFSFGWRADICKIQTNYNSLSKVLYSKLKGLRGYKVEKIRYFSQ